MSHRPTIKQPEPSHDILRRTSVHPLTSVFAPKSVALIGATETPSSVGRTILENLTAQTFGGAVFPVNPKRATVLGINAYPNVASLPERPDLAVICTPASSVPGLIGECVDAGIKGAVIISAGFKETGAPGIALEQEILELARGKMRIIGPNCLGVMAPKRGLNATFAADMARPGSVGFLSQSGALCTAILDWSLKENVGFSAFVSLGSMLDVGWGDLINHLGDDPNTTSIVIYMESIGDARSFLSAAREVALTKPIIVIKPGRTEAAAKAAASHTGSLTGSDEVLQAAFQRVGVLRVEAISELFDMAEVLGKQPRPKGPRLTIVTNAGGPSVIATDMLIGSGAQLADLSPETMAAFNAILPPTWSHNNPVDIIGDAKPELYAKAVEIAAKDPNTDGLLVILTPQAMTDPTATAECLKPYAHIPNKPVIASWMGADIVVDPAVESPYAKLAPARRAAIFECVGVPGLLQQVLEKAPRDARVIVAGVCMEPDTIEPMFAIFKELSLQFVLGYTPEEFARSLLLLAEGKVDAEALITSKVGLDGVKGAFEALANPERHTKILVEPWR